MSTRAGWALSLTGLAVAGLFASWQSGGVTAFLSTGCSPAAVGWSYDVEAGADGSTHVVGLRFDDVPAACAGAEAQVRFRQDGKLVDQRVVALGRQDVRATVPFDAVDWAPAG
jgi:hypothetical protein